MTLPPAPAELQLSVLLAAGMVRGVAPSCLAVVRFNGALVFVSGPSVSAGAAGGRGGGGGGEGGVAWAGAECNFRLPHSRPLVECVLSVELRVNARPINAASAASAVGAAGAGPPALKSPLLATATITGPDLG